MTLEAKIEAILFYKNEPESIKSLSKILGEEEGKIREAIKNLSLSFEGRGLCLLENKDEISLATSKEASSLIEQITKDELATDIGKAGLETLSIILYNGVTSRREIDYVRGVNSTFILRHLSMRGLIEKVEDNKDGRGFRYRVSTNLLAHLGIKNIEDLPEYKEFKQKMQELEKEDARNDG